LEAAIAEIRAELEALNIEEIMEMAKKANERIDIMDLRCDAMVCACSFFLFSPRSVLCFLTRVCGGCGTQDQSIQDLKEYVLRKEKELEEQQLEKQIEAIRAELAEAKQGLFTKGMRLCVRVGSGQM
jgi:hypothetical protein